MTCKIKRAVVIDAPDEEDDKAIEIPHNKLVVVTECDKPVECRKRGNLKYRSFYLSEIYDWKIVKDDRGIICLLPLKKESSYIQ
jgi:hypothetical protein